jgi:hypothetical protein
MSQIKLEDVAEAGDEQGFATQTIPAKSSRLLNNALSSKCQFTTLPPS